MSWIVYAERDGECADYGWLLLSVHGDRLDAELEAAALRREAAEWRQAWRELWGAHSEPPRRWEPASGPLLEEAAQMLPCVTPAQAWDMLSGLGVDAINFHAGTIGGGRL